MTLHRLRMYSGELASIFAAIFLCNLSWKWRMAEINPKLEDVFIDVLYCVKHRKKSTSLPKVQNIWHWVNGLLCLHCTKSSSWRVAPCSIPWEHRDPCPCPSWCCSPRGQPGSHQIPPGITNHHFSSVCKKHKKIHELQVGNIRREIPEASFLQISEGSSPNLNKHGEPDGYALSAGKDCIQISLRAPISTNHRSKLHAKPLHFIVSHMCSIRSYQGDFPWLLPVCRLEEKKLARFHPWFHPPAPAGCSVGAVLLVVGMNNPKVHL